MRNMRTWHKRGAVVSIMVVAIAALSTMSLTTAGTTHAAPVRSTQPTASTPIPATDAAVDSTIVEPNCYQPPTDASMATLAAMSDSELARYGMPLHALVPNAKEWAFLVAHDKHRSCTGIETKYIFGANTASQSSTANNEHGPQSTSNWAGYDANSAEGWKVSEVSWYVPVVNDCNILAQAADWSGIGGVNGSIRLIQSGSADTATLCINTAYWAWVENYGNQSGQPGYNSNYPYSAINVFSVHPGDFMYSYTYQVPGHVEMYVEDSTNSMYADYAFGPTPQPSFYECIHEKASGNDLLNTPDVTFYGCEGEDNNSNWSLINNNNHAYTELWIYQGSQLDAETSSPPDSSGDFTAYYIQ